MPATNAGPKRAVQFDPKVVDELAQQSDEDIAAAFDALETPEEQQQLFSLLGEAKKRVQQSDTTAAQEADDQTWQASLGTESFGRKEAPTELQMLVHETEQPQRLRDNLQAITDTGRTLPPTAGSEGKALTDVPQGTKFSVREAQDGNGVDVVYQEPGSQEWNLYDPPGISKNNVMAWLRETLTLGNLSSAAADAAVTGKAGMAGRAAISAATAVGGRVLDEVREPGQQTLGDLGGDAVESGVGGAIGSGLSDLAGAASNAVRGRGFRVGAGSETELQARVREGQNVMSRQGWDPLSLGEAGVPVYRSAENTAAATGLDETARREQRLAQPLASLRNMAGGDTVADVPIETLQEVRDAALEDARKDFSVGLQDLYRTGELRAATPEQFGRRTQEAYADYVRAEKAIGGKMFEDATAEAQAKGVTFKLDSFLDDIRQWRELVDLKGLPDEEGNDTVAKWAQGYRPQFRQLFRIVDELNPEQPAEYLDGVRRIQSWLGGLSEPKAGMVVDPEAIRVASALSASLDQAMRSSPGAEPYFAALDQAKGYWSNILKFQRTMDLFKPQSDQTASYGERVYRAFAGGDQELLTEQGAMAALRVLKHRPNGVAEFRGAVARDAMRNPDRINNLLLTADTLKALPNGTELFPVSLRNALEAYQARLANADYGQIEKQIKVFQSGAATAKTMIERGNIDEIKLMLRQGVWTKDQLRGYVLSQLASQSEKEGVTRGAQLLDPGKYQTALKALKESGVFDLLDPKSRELLGDVSTISEFVGAASDIGSGMAAGSINQRRAQNLPISPVALYGTLKQKQVAMRAWLGSRPTFVRLKGYGAAAPTDWRMTREVVRMATEAVARSNLSPDLSTPAEQPQQ